MSAASIWDCAHEQHELRMRRIEGGGIQYRRQCLRCGGSVGNAVSQANVRELPPPWDADLPLKWSESRRAIALQRRDAEVERRREEYAAYLLTPQWRTKRQAVLERERYRCQGCMVGRATEVHHTTYANVGDELLFQLVALCEPCHRKAHHSEEDRA